MDRWTSFLASFVLRPSSSILTVQCVFYIEGGLNELHKGDDRYADHQMGA